MTSLNRGEILSLSYGWVRFADGSKLKMGSNYVTATLRNRLEREWRKKIFPVGRVANLNCLLCEEDKKVYLLSIATLQITLKVSNLKHISHSFCGLEMGCGLAGSSAFGSPSWCQPTFQQSWSLSKLDWGRTYNQDHSCGCSEDSVSHRMLDRGPWVLVTCWPEDSLSSLPHGPLCKITNNMAAGFYKGEQVRE